MYFDDLSYIQSDASRLTIGWLEPPHKFRVGTTSQEFQDRLRPLCGKPIRKTRGFHYCPYCTVAEVHGDGEIDVIGLDGTIFVSPVLISHYVESHGYLPPQQYIDSVVSLPWDNGPMNIDLSPFLLAVLNNPSPEVRNAFYNAFTLSLVGARIQSGSHLVQTGTHVATGKDQFQIPVGKGPDGHSALIVFADVRQMAKREKGVTFMELAASDLISMAILKNYGIVVQSYIDDLQCWVAIPKSDVVLLKGKLSCVAIQQGMSGE